jgi:hypothetical protein
MVKLRDVWGRVGGIRTQISLIARLAEVERMPSDLVHALASLGVQLDDIYLQLDDAADEQDGPDEEGHERAPSMRPAPQA